MNGYKPVMEANGQFVRRISLVRDPIAYVVEQLTKIWLDAVWRYAEIAL